MNRKKTRKAKAKNKSAQIQMGETIAVIVIITIMIFFGLAFYSKIKTLDFKEQADKYTQLDTIQLANTVSNMPELLCSKQQVIDVNCIDKYKIFSLQKSITDGAATAFFYYGSMFGNSRIKVIQIYPPAGEKLIYENNMTANQSTETVLIPVNIYDPITGDNAFGVLSVEAYS